MVPFVNGWLVGMTAPRCRGLRVAMGADAKQSGSSGVVVSCQGQRMIRKP